MMEPSGPLKILLNKNNTVARETILKFGSGLLAGQPFLLCEACRLPHAASTETGALPVDPSKPHDASTSR